jgi:phosphoribosylcarboxyaminoimidazole (NCAIR) mutase
MSEPASNQVPVLLVLGPDVHAEIVDEIRKVLYHFGINFKEGNWNAGPDLLTTGSPGLQVVILATGLAYTDEHFALPADLTVPVIRVITDPDPPPEQILKATAFSAGVGFGVQGAVNAGLLAARIFALTDAGVRELLKTKPYQAP